ncbi:MAG: YkgJ family cysteine cluster protein [Planctomycetota bacterium]|jgi:Fe-S-cluster containining protein
MANKKKGRKTPRGRRKRSQQTGHAFVLDEKCKGCPALCCRYIAWEIDTPEDEEDFDNLRWYLIHKNVSVYVTDDEWHLCVDVPCRHLKGNRCQIHDVKPLLCRQHDPDECEYNNPNYQLDHEFRSWEDLRAYMRKKGLRKLILAK